MGQLLDMLAIHKATGEVTWDYFVIKPMMTIATLERIIAAHSDNGTKPTLLGQNANLTPDKFPAYVYPPEKQDKIDSDWPPYRSWLATLKEIELPELERGEFPIAYKIKGLLTFQHELVRQIRLWLKFPAGDFPTSFVPPTFDPLIHELCLNILHEELGVLPLGSEAFANYAVQWSRFNYDWGTVELSDDLDPYYRFSSSIVICFGKGIQPPNL